MPVAGLRRDLDSFLIKIAGFLHTPQFLQRLSAMKVSRRVSWVAFEQNFEFGQRAFPFAAIGVLHRQSVSRKAVLRIMRQHVPENFHPIRRHVPTCYYTERWRARFSTQRLDWNRVPGWCRRDCLLATPIPANAAPQTNHSSPTPRKSGRCATSDMAAAVARDFQRKLLTTRSDSTSSRIEVNGSESNSYSRRIAGPGRTESWSVRERRAGLQPPRTIRFSTSRRTHL